MDTDTASYCNCSDMIRYRQMMSDLSDTYLLKSLDTFDFDALDNERLALVPCEGPVQRCTLQSGKAARENVKPLRLTADMSIGRSGSGETLDLLSIQL